jgi:hypothetical protein
MYLSLKARDSGTVQAAALIEEFGRRSSVFSTDRQLNVHDSVGSYFENSRQYTRK